MACEYDFNYIVDKSIIDLLLWSRRMRGEREAGHKGTREVGNVDPYTEITFQFGANEQDAEGEKKTGIPPLKY